VNYDNSLVVTITVTCYSWAPSSGDHLFTCVAIFWPPHHFPLHYCAIKKFEEKYYWETRYK